MTVPQLPSDLDTQCSLAALLLLEDIAHGESLTVNWIHWIVTEWTTFQSCC
jgi:hypothetical protein